MALEEVIDAFPGEMTPDLEGPIIDPYGSDEAVDIDPAQKLWLLANKAGDFSEALDIDDLTRIGCEVVEDYDRDKTDRKSWTEIAEEALALAAQDHNGDKKTYPWIGASNVRFPLLTTAALQFNARSYPAIVKGDEAISVKVVGQDKGRPRLDQTGQPVMQGPDGQPIPQQMAALLPPEVQQMLQPLWAVPPGGKAKRAQRVAEYLNTVLFYRMEDWESDTDSLLMQLPIVGCAFRKIWYDPASRMQKSAFVSALRIFVPEGARSCDTTPRLTEEIPDVYPHQIAHHQRSGFYRDILLTGSETRIEGDATAAEKAAQAETEENDGARLLLEQHRMIDLDEDGLEEPYIVTVDYETQRVLRIEANFSPDDVKVGEDGRVLQIKRGKFYVKYDFFPHPEGKFYGIGLGHLLKQLGDVVDTAINQIVDAGHAQTAGGGFIASGVRLQTRGGGSLVRFAPGEYKTVDVPGSVLRDAIVERTLPNVSPVTFQVLDLILGAARDISGVKDVMTGEASNMGQVGTTLALIEQGLQVFNAVYKRIYRALKEEFSLIYENVAKFGGEDAARDYADIMDDPFANFEQDFMAKDMDVRPVSEPGSVTQMQRMARAQFLMGTVKEATAAGGNPQEIMRRVYDAANIEDIDKIFPPAPPAQPDPEVMAKAEKLMADAQKAIAQGAKAAAETAKIKLDTEVEATGLGMAMGMAA